MEKATAAEPANVPRILVGRDALLYGSFLQLVEIIRVEQSYGRGSHG
ncbi:MAG: hypothetical protein QMD66_04865 [Actinomycetota bacterium]|nr:hypothetical protein [Actinomycetota bacterium]MDI6822180.1 hypothetical protein [Actinomycetota bacterium]